MISQILANPVCWAILILALFCYQQLWSLFLQPAFAHQQDAERQQQFCAVLIGTLPLLGLLGTIMGLLDCFAGIAQQGASGALLSGGIADALLTTQLGLLCAVPAWILQAVIRARHIRQTALVVEA